MPITPKEAADRMAKIWINRGDIEADHWAADTLLLEVLLELGYVDLVEGFNKLPKWYA